jgi:hypothetical protein
MKKKERKKASSKSLQTKGEANILRGEKNFNIKNYF